MALDRIFLTFLGAELLFLVSGALLLIFALTTQAQEAKPYTVESVARDLLLGECPIKASIGNAILIFVTFLIAVPGIVIPTTRGWLKLHGFMVAVCAVFTLVIGLDIWFETLKTRENLSVIWNQQPNNVQSLLQQELKCCGYFNSTSPPFVPDVFCKNPQFAAAQLGCVRPFSNYSNNFLDIVFTGAFGIVGFDAVLIVVIAIILKDRKEKARYRHIDEKNGTRAF